MVNACNIEKEGIIRVNINSSCTTCTCTCSQYTMYVHTHNYSQGRIETKGIKEREEKESKGTNLPVDCGNGSYTRKKGRGSSK